MIEMSLPPEQLLKGAFYLLKSAVGDLWTTQVHTPTAILAYCSFLSKRINLPLGTLLNLAKNATR